jgi:MFS family permease
MGALSFFDRSRIVAKPGFSRWLVPPAALSIHLAIGQAYAFSVFKKPLNYLIQVHTAGGGLKALPASMDSPNPVDWSFPDLAWIFILAIVFLGLSAAVFGKWLERVGPRKAMFASAVCFGSGFFISALGVQIHQLWLIYIGYGVIGGTGLGIGYISPVSTLIKWFPDRPGMATGMAIMGFGGGALIGSPLARNLMDHFRTNNDLGVMKTFLVMGAIYFVAMMFGVITVRIPAPGWKPEGWTAPAKPKSLVTTHDVEVNRASGTPQFWLVWIVLCMNVSAGIGILEQASPMIQELFKHLLCVLYSGWNSLLPGAAHGHQRPEQRSSLCDRGSRNRQHVWRRLRHRPCLLEGSVWNHGGRRHSRPPAHRMVSGRNRGAVAGEPHPRV